jgi:glutaminyl-peptide cyclotransferase
MARSTQDTVRTADTHPGTAPPTPRRRGLFRALIAGLVIGVLVGGFFLMHALSGKAEPPPGKTEFAAERPGADVSFDAKRAMGYLEDICKIGTRISGSEGMKKQQELLDKHFTNLGAKVTYQKFTARQKSRPRPLEMANLIASWHPERKVRVILCSHYDTRPMADQELDRRLWKEPFLSANDGGSGCALLMELGHSMKDLKTEVGVDFVFFDGEEYVWDHDDDYFFGSREFGKRAVADRKTVTYRGAILLDMIAGKTAKFPVEQNSWNRAPDLCRQVWGIAAELKATQFVHDRMSKVAVEDDHMALNRSGIKAIDLIDFDYPYWHKVDDVPKNCSGESMEQVARVLAVWLQRVK